MKRSILSALVLAMLAAPTVVVTNVHAEEAASPHTFTANAAVVSDYRFRGISQTFKAPALQGGADYSHSSGFYLGTWASTISSKSFPGGSVEIDLYGGYKWEVAKDVMLDVGALYYYYPSAKWKFLSNNVAGQGQKFNNTELYVGTSYKWLSGKISYAISDYFGMNQNTLGGLCETGAVGGNTTNCIPNNRGGSKGTTYVELNVAFPATDKLTLNAHVGRTDVRHYSQMSYTDWKFGVGYDLAGWILGAHYVDTNANKGFYNVGTNNNTTNQKKLGTSTVVLSVSKTF